MTPSMSGMVTSSTTAAGGRSRRRRARHGHRRPSARRSPEAQRALEGLPDDGSSSTTRSSGLARDALMAPLARERGPRARPSTLASSSLRLFGERRRRARRARCSCSASWLGAELLERRLDLGLGDPERLRELRGAVVLALARGSWRKSSRRSRNACSSLASVTPRALAKPLAPRSPRRPALLTAPSRTRHGPSPR